MKNYNVTINRKNFYDQPTGSDIKRYEEIRKSATSHEDCTKRCLLNYEYIKNHHKLIAMILADKQTKKIRPQSKSNSENIIYWTVTKY